MSIKIPGYPRVWRSKVPRAVAIVYSNRVEYYFTNSAHSFQVFHGYDGESYNPYRAEEVLMNEGFKRVHFDNDPSLFETEDNQDDNKEN
jgi:hypothetical protein